MSLPPRRAAPAALLLLLLAACGRSPARAPWLTMPSLAAHAAWFPIGPADVHGAPIGQAPDCNACHVDRSTGQPSSTFRTWTCTGCHVPLATGVSHDDTAALATLHGGVSGYAAAVAAQAPLVASANGGVGPQLAEDGACLQCHPAGWAIDHATRFPLPHQDAAGTNVAACADCHVDAADRTRLGCASCHPHDEATTASAHALVPDYVGATATSPLADVVAASALCVRCHGDATVPVTVAGHPAASGGFAAEAAVHAGPAGGACLDCHPAARTDKPFAADFATFTCAAACHGAVPVTAAGLHDDSDGALGTFHATTGADFPGTVAALGLSGACRSCHPDGTGGLPADHPFPVGAVAPAHPLGTCGGCHTTVTDRNVVTNIDCATCHLGLPPPAGSTDLGAFHAASAIPVTDYATPAARCLYCHADAQVNRPASHPTGDATPIVSDPAGNPQQAQAHLTAGCANCHRIARTDKPFAAADWTQTNCLGCHDTATGPSGP